MRKNTLINLAGLLLALAIASGGLLGVQVRLARDEARLLQGGGMVELSVLSEPEHSEEISDVQVQRTLLAEDSLALVIQNLESGAEPYPHEPGRNQLSMAEAVEYGRSWLESFFMPHLDMDDFNLNEQKTICYLWTTQEDTPLLSYWTVTFSTKNMEAELILNAMSGQILDASVRCALPAEHQDPESLMALLNDYAVSFGPEEKSVPAESNEENAEISGRTMYQSIGSKGIFAAMNVSSIIVGVSAPAAGLDVDFIKDRELLSIRLRLTSKIAE